MIEVSAKSPVSWFLAVEIRPFAGEPRLGEKARAFGRREDGGASPYALAAWDDGPFFQAGGFITAIDVVSCAGRRQAVEIAATHPLARHRAIEVRPFESG